MLLRVSTLINARNAKTLSRHGALQTIRSSLTTQPNFNSNGQVSASSHGSQISTFQSSLEIETGAVGSSFTSSCEIETGNTGSSYEIETDTIGSSSTASCKTDTGTTGSCCTVSDQMNDINETSVKHPTGHLGQQSC